MSNQSVRFLSSRGNVMQNPACFRAICVVALLLYCALAGAQYKMPSRPPSIGPSESQAGTNFKGHIATGDLPSDKRYSELTQDQKNKFKAQYQSKAADDEPPFPVDGLAGLYKPIAEAQTSLSQEGPLEMEVEVDATGKARSVSVRKSPSPEMTQVAAAALMFQTYKPAVCNGKPCAMVFPLRVELMRR